jgi:hypothetical protein
MDLVFAPPTARTASTFVIFDTSVCYGELRDVNRKLCLSNAGNLCEHVRARGRKFETTVK